MERLVSTVQELSLARDLGRITEVVRAAARALTGADGATFVLREHGQSGDVCFYVDEDAIGPLWKGRRFPASSCISGWAMRHRRAVIVEDAMADPRVPTEAYAPTFVKSLVMVPIRSAAPIGAIGCYWAVRQRPSEREVQLLQALADSTSVAMENVEVYADLEARVAVRTAELAEARADLALENEALTALAHRKDELSALVVHDIKGPASALMLRAEQRMRRAECEAERSAWRSIYINGEAVARLANNLLDIAQHEDAAFAPAHEDVAVAAIVDEVVRRMQPLAEARDQRVTAQLRTRAVVHADPELLRRALQNLVENAIAFNAKGGTVALDARDDRDAVVLAVSDEGPGVPADQRDRIFEKYARVPSSGAPRTGHGLGLAFCRLAAEAHGGAIWVEDVHPHGSRFCLRLPRASGDAVARTTA
jgi:signal transduction histidine kinase